jgi:hypothetical protein
MLLRLAAFLLAFVGLGESLHAEQKVAIIVREGSAYASPSLSQTATGKVKVDSIFRVEGEKTDSVGRPWVQLSTGAEKMWVQKNLCVVRAFEEFERVAPFVKLVRAQPWSDFDKERILRGVVDVAMTGEQVLLSWGTPAKIIKLETTDGKQLGEEWSYGPFSLILRGGVVADILSKPTPLQKKQ